jgi:quercetin dioxygenase-like cupin family protein
VSLRVAAGALPALADSPLALTELRLEAGDEAACGDAGADTLLYVAAGEGSLDLEGTHPLEAGGTAFVAAGESGVVRAKSYLRVVRATVGPGADRHAPLGDRERVVASDGAKDDRATGARSFRVLLGPHNGSTRATLFLGFVPPGKAPWHYHLYDEIVWVPDGPGRLHLDSGAAAEELGPGSAFRLRPREIHVVENTSPDRPLTILGLFTPAGSPSAAYLSPDVADSYRLESV